MLMYQKEAHVKLSVRLTGCLESKKCILSPVYTAMVAMEVTMEVSYTNWGIIRGFAHMLTTKITLHNHQLISNTPMSMLFTVDKNLVLLWQYKVPHKDFFIHMYRGLCDLCNRILTTVYKVTYLINRIYTKSCRKGE